MITLRELAEREGVTYEAIRRLRVKYDWELRGHVKQNGRVQMLDDFAEQFLIEKRRSNPVVVYDQERADDMRHLREQIENLKTELLNAQSQLLAAQQNQMQLVESNARMQGLLEAHSETEKQLTETRAALSKAQADAAAELMRVQESAKVEREGLEKQLAAAQDEVQAYTKSWFGFYRKRK